MKKRGSKKTRSGGQQAAESYFHISSVASKFNIHPQTLRLYEREGLLRPSRSEGNTRLYTEEDIKQLGVILNLIRELGVNLAGVEVILNMRERMRQMEDQVSEFLEYIRTVYCAGKEDEFESRRRSLVKVPSSGIVKSGEGEPEGS
ncbi:MAG: helix-turn-helix transcriptional regulator [Candidatus Aminicenantes bacterium]|nr:helix-turn-helix transcriptional regulator [Candidatus Aminicenantes bacterium]